MPGDILKLDPKVLKQKLPPPTKANQNRFKVQMATLEVLLCPELMANYHKLATANHKRWAAVARPALRPVRVFKGDWGIVTQHVSKESGHTFAVLNMANAFGVGGGFLQGMVAQEENIFRRTDCAGSIRVDEVQGDFLNEGSLHYTEQMTRLINGEDGRVYIDAEHPRVCFRDAETPLEYPYLPNEDIYQFIEMRAAALDLRPYEGQYIDMEPKSDYYRAMQKRIEAQFLTLMEKGIRHVVLSAFGCGVFKNKADIVANIYKEQIGKYAKHFDNIVFAIYDGEYGPKNAPVFAEVLDTSLEVVYPGSKPAEVSHPVFKTAEVSPAVEDPSKILGALIKKFYFSANRSCEGFNYSHGREASVQFAYYNSDGGRGGVSAYIHPFQVTVSSQGDLIYMEIDSSFNHGHCVLITSINDPIKQQEILKIFIHRISAMPYVEYKIDPAKSQSLIEKILERSRGLAPSQWTEADGKGDILLQFGVGRHSRLPTVALPNAQVMVQDGQLVYLQKVMVGKTLKFTPVTDPQVQEVILNEFILRITEIGQGQAQGQVNVVASAAAAIPSIQSSVGGFFSTPAPAPAQSTPYARSSMNFF